MITIHATKKLYAKLPLDDNEFIINKHGNRNQNTSPIDNNPLNNWHANLITLQRRNCILMVHDATRFPVFMKGLVKQDFENFDWLFEDALMNTLLKIGGNDTHIKKAHALLQPCQFDTNCNRSVQGTMNQMKRGIDCTLEYDQARIENMSSYHLSAWLADTLCGGKGIKEDYIKPSREMLKLLSSPYDSSIDSDTQTDTGNVVNLNDYRKSSN